MSGPTEIPPYMQPAQPARGRRHGALWYSTLLVMAQVLGLAAFVAIAPTSWFLDHDNVPNMRFTIGYGARLRGAHCDVLLYGDSSAMIGLNPAVIQAETGLTACNIAEISYVQQMAGSYEPVDNFLRHNDKPRILVTSWAPQQFHPFVTPGTEGKDEGIEYALLYAPRAQTMHTLLRHPLWIVQFGIWVGSRLSEELIARLSGHRAHILAAIVRDTHAGYTYFPLPPQTGCDALIPTRFSSRERSSADIAAFRAHYAALGIPVIFNVSPVAECTPDHAQLRLMTEGFSDNAFQFWPPGMFNERSVHLTPAAAEVYSKQVAAQVLVALQAARPASQEKPHSR